MSRLISTARDLAIKYHDGQRDKIGRDYFDSHVEPVANYVRSWGGTEYQVTAAYLHDLPEDTPITLEYLEGMFPRQVVDIVDALTRRPEESHDYQLFIRRVILTPDAVLDKIADITSNMDPARLFYLDPERRNRVVAKYTKALPTLWEAYRGR